MYPGIPQMLEQTPLAGKALVIATSKPENFARSIAARYGIDHYFALIAGSEMDETRTEKHQVIEYALKTCGITDCSSRVLMVGDRMHDVVGAAKFSIIDCMGCALRLRLPQRASGRRRRLYCRNRRSQIAPMILGK